jgi:transposase
MPSPKLVPPNMTDDERRTLDAWVRRRTTARALAARSQIVLTCAAGGTIGSVASELGVSRDMVSKWRGRFVRDRLEGLTDEPRPGRPRTISDKQVERVITKTLEERGPGADSHWSTRSMAAASGMSQSAVSRIWRAFGLNPHLVETWKLPADPQFIEKVRDIVGLYLDPPEKALVLCVDEKSQIQAMKRPPCIHPRQLVVDQPGRTLVRRAHQPQAGQVNTPPVAELEADIRNRVDERNKNPRPFVWTKTAGEILDTLAAYSGRINDSGH